MHIIDYREVDYVRKAILKKLSNSNIIKITKYKNTK
jgi:hypothetical protein